MWIEENYWNFKAKWLMSGGELLNLKLAELLVVCKFHEKFSI